MVNSWERWENTIQWQQQTTKLQRDAMQRRTMLESQEHAEYRKEKWGYTRGKWGCKKGKLDCRKEM